MRGVAVNRTPSVRRPARQWGERVRTGFPGGLAVQRRTKCQSRSHGTHALYRVDEGRSKASPRISLAREAAMSLRLPMSREGIPRREVQAARGHRTSMWPTSPLSAMSCFGCRLPARRTESHPSQPGRTVAALCRLRSLAQCGRPPRSGHGGQERNTGNDRGIGVQLGRSMASPSGAARAVDQHALTARSCRRRSRVPSR